MLEKAGCHVVYGLVGLKTHCKTALVIRQEGNQIRRYAHIGTGNYHPKTARLYEDLGLLTSDKVVTEDVALLFNHLSGFGRSAGYRRIPVAPPSVRRGGRRAGRPRGPRPPPPAPAPAPGGGVGCWPGRGRRTPARGGCSGTTTGRPV